MINIDIVRYGKKNSENICGHIAQPYKHILSVWHDGAVLPEGCGGHVVHKLSEGQRVGRRATAPTHRLQGETQ